MKPIFLSLLVVFVFCISKAQTNKKPYSFKTAYVEYEIEGNTKGKQTLYFDDWGWNKSETTQTVTKMFGQKTETNERKVTLKLDLYQWTTGEKTGSKIHNTMLEDLLADPSFNMNEFGLKTMESLGFEKTGKETVNGKPCDIWKGLGSTIWIWKDIAVKTQVKMLGTKYVMTATKIELNASIPGGEFQIPSNIKFTESSLDPSQMMLQGSQENNTNSDETEPEIKSLKDLKSLFKK